jgi:hypothetical protein
MLLCLPCRRFIKTNYGIQIIFYFLHGNCMLAFCFMLSSLFISGGGGAVPPGWLGFLGF